MSEFKVGDKVRDTEIYTVAKNAENSELMLMRKDGTTFYAYDNHIELVKSTAVVDINELTVLESEPTAPTLILEPGKEYLAFPNWRMRCISDLRMEEEGEYPVVMERYSKVKGWKGPFYYKKDGTHKYADHNIIGPWNSKPVVDWSLYSKWTQAVAMDKNGIWHWFDARPVLTRADTWNAFKGYLSGIIPPEYAPKNADGSKWEGDWEDSLVVREDGE